MFSRRSRRIGTGAALALLAVPLAALAQSPGVTTRASVSSAGEQADGSSFAPSLSEDGRYVAFASAASNLVPSDGNGVIDVFVRDRLAETTERVSIATDGAEANGRSDSAKISRNGRFVAFQSAATNLIGSDGNGVIDVFVHDRETGVTGRVSRAIDGGDPDLGSDVDSISDNGRYVGFWSAASNLVDDDGNDTWDSFVFDRHTVTTERVSVAMTGGDANQGAFWAAVSGDGRFVAFASPSANLTPQPMYGGGRQPNIFVRDRVAGTTKRISQQPDGLYESAESGEPSISRDGRFVAYSSTSRNLTSTLLRARRRIYVTDVVTLETELVAPDFPNQDCPFECLRRDAAVPSISADGRFVAFMSKSQQMMPANYNGMALQARVYVADRLTGFLRRISVDPDHGVGSACANRPAISGDGRVVAYHTNSDDLVVDDTNLAADVLVSEWACDNTGAYASPDALPASCDPVPACPDAPADGCDLATRSSLHLQTQAPGTDGPSRARLRWSWRGSLTNSDLGDPTDDSSFALCVYTGPDARLQLEERLPAGAGWSSTRSGYAYEAEAGVTKATLRAGRRDGIQVVGNGPELDLPYLPLDDRGPILVRLHRSDGGCAAADLAPTDIKKNKAARLRVDRPGRPGRFLARHS